MKAKRTWKCDVCGYIHEGSAPPSQCPVCGVSQDEFSPLETPAAVPATPPVSRWRCIICDYVHDGPEPPDVCPVCSASRDHFVALHEESKQASPLGVQSILIVGAGIAGLTAAEKARATNPNCRITIISREPGLPYYRLNLTRMLAGEVDESELIIQRDAWFEKSGIELMEEEVTAIDTSANTVNLAGGGSLDFQSLILANGSHAFVPPFSGVSIDGVQVFRTLEDAHSILARAEAGKDCVCIGGGLLGLETAGALKRRGLNVSVVEGFGWLLQRQLPRVAGQMLANYIESLGIDVYLDGSVSGILGDTSVRAVSLEDGRELQADIVVISTGVRANSYLARRSDLSVAKGVVVNDRMQTSNPFVYAAGDVAEHRGSCPGIWPVAYAQGVVAGINAAGGEAVYEPIPPSNRLKVMDVDLFSIGHFESQDASYCVYDEESETTFKRFVVRDGTLVGAVLYGDTSVAGAVKEAIERGTQVREVEGLLDRLPGFASFMNSGTGT